MSTDIVRGLDCIVILNRVLGFLDADILELMCLRIVSSTWLDTIQNYSRQFWINAVKSSIDAPHAGFAFRPTTGRYTRPPPSIGPRVVDPRLHKFFERVFWPMVREGADSRWLVSGLSDSGFSLNTSVFKCASDATNADSSLGVRPFIHQFVDIASLNVEYECHDSVVDALDFLLTRERDRNDGSAREIFLRDVVNSVWKGDTPLGAAVKKGAGAKVVRLLLKHGAYPLGPLYEPYLNTTGVGRPTMLAAQFNRPDELQAMLEYVEGAQGREAAQQLLRFGWKAAPERTNMMMGRQWLPGDEATVLSVTESESVARLILSWINEPSDINGDIAGADNTTNRRKNLTPLMRACKARALEVVKLLLATGKCDVWREAEHGISALFFACAPPPVLVELLLSQPGFDPNAPAVAHAVESAHGIEVNMVLYKHGVKLSQYNERLVLYRMLELKEQEEKSRGD